MNKRLISLCLFVFLSASIFQVRADETGPGVADSTEQQGSNPEIVKKEIIRPVKLVTRVRSGRVREEPSFDAAVEYGLKEGDVVSVLKKMGRWYYVERDDGKRGWGHESIFITTEVPQSTPERETLQEESEKSLSTNREEGPDVEPTIPEEEEESPVETAVEEMPDVQKENTFDHRESSKSDTGVQWVGDEMLSINFLNVDIREALSALALEREINIVTSNEVKGNITIHLYNSTLDQALDAITLAGGFSFIKKGNLYYVFKPKEAKDPQAERLQMKIFKLKYAGVDKVQEILNSIPEMRPVRIHDSTKTIIAEDTPENIKKIEKIISQWDQIPKQVMIEAKILEITLTDDMSFGVNWNAILGDSRVGTGGLSTATMPTNTPVSPVPNNGKGIFSNLITAAGTDKQFTAALDALQSKTRINTLSTPKILAIHGKPAKVQVGGQQGYTVTTTNDGVSTETIEFIDTGTILQITPFIDDEDNILLDVRPSIRSARIEQGIPVVSSTEVATWLTAKNGETIFIGGLIQDTKTRTRDMIPCLGGVPGIGALFGRSTSGTGKSELVVLITPTVLNSSPSKAGSDMIEKTKKTEESFNKEPLSTEDRFLELLSPVK